MCARRTHFRIHTEKSARRKVSVRQGFGKSKHLVDTDSSTEGRDEKLDERIRPTRESIPAGEGHELGLSERSEDTAGLPGQRVIPGRHHRLPDGTAQEQRHARSDGLLAQRLERSQDPESAMQTKAQPERKTVFQDLLRKVRW